MPGVEWQRCTVHFERNVLSNVPASEMSEVAEDLKAIFKVSQRVSQQLNRSVVAGMLEEALGVRRAECG